MDSNSSAHNELEEGKEDKINNSEHLDKVQYELELSDLGEIRKIDLTKLSLAE